MLWYISFCLFVSATAQLGPPSVSGNDCMNEACMNKADEEEFNCGECIQQDQTTGVLSWDSNRRNCETTNNRNWNLKRFLDCEKAYLTQQRNLDIWNCQTENKLYKCRGGQLPQQSSCVEMFTFQPEPMPPGPGLSNNFPSPVPSSDEWSQSGSMDPWMQGTPSTNWRTEKRSIRSKRQSTNVWTDTCFYAFNSSLTKCPKVPCKTDHCGEIHRAEFDRLDVQYKDLEKKFEACVRVFDRSYDRPNKFNNRSPSPARRRR